MNNQASQSPLKAAFSRRNLLRGAAGTAAVPALAGLLAACSGGSESGSSGGETLEALLWAGLFEQGLPGFEEEYGIAVNITPQVDPLQSVNMVKSQPGQFDVSTFGVADTPFITEGLVQTLDVDRVTEMWEAQYPYFREMWNPEVLAPESYGGNPYSLATMWGSNVLAWNTDKIDAPDSWLILGDPDLKGRTALIDQAAEIYGTMRIALGEDQSLFGEADFAAVDDIANQWLSNAKMFWSTGDDIKQLLVQEEVWVTYMTDGWARQLVRDGYPVAYTYPTEGVRGWLDGMGVLEGSERVDQAYDFINYTMSEEFAVEMSEETLYASGNQNVAGQLSAETQEIMRIDQMEQTLTDGRVNFQKLTAEDFTAVDEWWTNLKLQYQG